MPTKLTSNLSASQVADLLIELERLIRLAINIPVLDSADRPGGYFSVINTNDGSHVITAAIGTVPDFKAEQYRTNAEEKTRRLREEMLAHGHTFSRQSRNPDLGKWGGAVVAGDWIFSFSGFSEAVDEALMVVLGAWLNFFPSPATLEEPLFAENLFIGTLLEERKKSESEDQD